MFLHNYLYYECRAFEQCDEWLSNDRDMDTLVNTLKLAVQQIGLVAKRHQAYLSPENVVVHPVSNVPLAVALQYNQLLNFLYAEKHLIHLTDRSYQDSWDVFSEASTLWHFLHTCFLPLMYQQGYNKVFGSHVLVAGDDGSHVTQLFPIVRAESTHMCGACPNWIETEALRVYTELALSEYGHFYDNTTAQIPYLAFCVTRGLTDKNTAMDLMMASNVTGSLTPKIVRAIQDKWTELAEDHTGLDGNLHSIIDFG